MKTKGFNISYNYRYNWIENQLNRLKRKKTLITFDRCHLLSRQEFRNLDLDKVYETVKTGKPIWRKCAFPDRICFSRYFGKTNTTYYVIVVFKKDFIEAITAWKKKGR